MCRSSAAARCAYVFRRPPSNRRILRLRGQGMPALGKPADRGDVYVTVDVQLPQSLTAEERRHYEALADLGQPARPVTTE